MEKRMELASKESLQFDGQNTLVGTYDIVGDIAVLRVPDTFKARSLVIAEAILRTQRRVKTVLLQASGVSGEFRLRRLEWLIGERKTQTTHREWGCTYKVDLGKCYFSPRLSFERMRVARMVKPGETVVNMFAGVGCFSVLMAKYGRAQTVYSIDVNPSAIKHLQENARLNRVEVPVVSVHGDAKDVITKSLQHCADRVVMPLPERAFEYLEYAVLALKATGGWIHYYDFEHASKGEDPVEKVKAKVTEKLRNLRVPFTVALGRIVRSTGPHWYQVVLDIQTFT